MRQEVPRSGFLAGCLVVLQAIRPTFQSGATAYENTPGMIVKTTALTFSPGIMLVYKGKSPIP